MFANDYNCLVGADPTIGPGAVMRGGSYEDGAQAGVFAVFAGVLPTFASGNVGFRCGR